MSRFDPCSAVAMAIDDVRTRKLEVLRQVYARATSTVIRRRSRTPAQCLCDAVAEVTRKGRQP